MICLDCVPNRIVFIALNFAQSREKLHLETDMHSVPKGVWNTNVYNVHHSSPSRLLRKRWQTTQPIC